MAQEATVARGEPAAHGKSAAQVYAAEELMHAGDFSAAVDAYRVLADPSDTSTYNYGIALYRTGQIEQAAEKFRSLLAAPQTSLAGRARFNLGNTHYARALAAIEPSEEAGETDLAGQGTAGQPDLDTAITQLQEAIGQYRSSLRVTPTDNDARANIELAQRLIRQLRDQQEQQQKDQQQQENEQQQQQQNQDGEQQDQQEQSSDSQDSSNESQEESGSPEENENDSDETSEQSSDDSQQESKKDQPGAEGDSKPQAGEKDDSAGNKGDPETDSNTPPSSNNNGERNESSDAEASDAEARADESTDEDESADSAADSAPTPEGELTAANEDSGEEKGDARPREIAPLEPGKLTPEEARKLLQSIRDRDMLRRYQRQMLERSRRVPVDRDW